MEDGNTAVTSSKYILACYFGDIPRPNLLDTDGITNKTERLYIYMHTYMIKYDSIYKKIGIEHEEPDYTCSLLQAFSGCDSP